jgi:hypothetical protein
MMPEAKPKSTQKPKAAPSPKPKKRPLIARGLPAAPGAGNIFVVKQGEELRANLSDRLEAMKRDFEKVEFFWSKIIKDPTFSETREYPELSQLTAMWELREGVRNLQEFKGRMKRLKVQTDFFEVGKDYELTVNEVVEILS